MFYIIYKKISYILFIISDIKYILNNIYYKYIQFFLSLTNHISYIRKIFYIL